jgi:hypothetical protein
MSNIDLGFFQSRLLIWPKTSRNVRRVNLLRIGSVFAFLPALTVPALAGGHAPLPDIDGGPLGLAVAAGVMLLIFRRKRAAAKA